MRFKRLRIVLGISIVVFILVAANIIAFGNFGKNVAAIPNKNSLTGSNTSLYPPSTANYNSLPAQNSAPVIQNTPPPTTIVQTFQTRAS